MQRLLLHAGTTVSRRLYLVALLSLPVNLPAVRATETNLELPTFENIRFKFFTSVPEHGNFRLPQMFYQGVTFGITALNSHDVEVTLQLPV